MRKRFTLLCPIYLLAILGPTAKAQREPLVVEHGTYSIHLLLHTIGTEEYTVTQSNPGKPDNQVMTTTSTTADRGTKRTTSSILTMGPMFTPVTLQRATGVAGTGENAPLLEVKGSSVTMREAGVTRTVSKPAVAFVASGPMPAAMQMMMMRYWKRHGQPSRLPVIRESDKALPLEIRAVGHDAFSVKGQMVRLTRYTVANLIFGREVLWMNDSGRLVALMTFAGGLPQEEILDEYEPATSEIVRSGVRQEVLDLADLDHKVFPEATGAFAIVGARVIDGTGSAAIENSTVVVRDGRIAAVGPSASIKVPAGTRIIHAEGKSLLPGLWEMHTHYSGVEFGPALLAAGVTTARDCGGEFEFLTTVRKMIDQDHALGPKLLLAGLIDSGGPLAFGNVDVENPAEAATAVDFYADAKFEQIKVYTQIQPEILKAIASEAHKRGMTVTGHVPAAMNAFEGIEDGMDQINHLQFVIRAMNPDGGVGPVDLDSEQSKKLIALLKERQIVVDPTNGWGEMAGHPKDIDPATFEPGINAAPFTLASKYRAMGVDPSETTKFRERMETNRKVVHALLEAGVPIVPGSDTGLIGYGLDRELELYVQAGMTPMQAIQSATIASARAMKLDKDSGSIEVGKRADLVLIKGNPDKNISDIRQVTSVVTNGRMYDSRKLAQSVGFTR
jgi:imidazolonepropionase-like amidohydrolase